MNCVYYFLEYFLPDLNFLEKQTPVTYLQALLDNVSRDTRPLGEESVHIVQFPVT